MFISIFATVLHLQTKKQMKNYQKLLLLLTLTGCAKEEPIIPNEEELITTVKITFTPSQGGDARVFQYQDLDGEGGNAPTVTAEALQANTAYNMSVEFQNESTDPVDNITEEVQEEGVDHQLFYSFTGGIGTLVYADQDDNGNPIGLQNTFTTGNASTGNMTLTLKHQPDKNAAGVKNGDITNAGGETDVEVTFYVEVN